MDDLTDFVQQVKRANDIVDVVGSYLELRQSGTNCFARCPFHGEKTASMSVNRNMQIFHCFGCGESGDVIKFVQKYESCTFMEAVEMLAKRAGLKMPELTRTHDKEFEKKKKKRDTYLEICKQTAIFYYKSFYSEKGRHAREYMEKRGYGADTLKKFGIGFSPDRDSLVKYLGAKGFSKEDCVKCGVLYQKQGNFYDSLSNRLIVPIYNMAGKVIAFGGRGLDERTIAFGKYKNTSDTPLFIKKDNLFAMNIAKQQKQQSALSGIIVVEGYMDVIAMHQAGFRCTVASMGTSLTDNQAKLLSRLTDTVYICYDGDSAGQKATVRGLDILDKAGLEVKVMSVPENLDPDEYIKKYGAEAFEKLIDAALPLPDYKLQLLEKAFPIDSSDSSKRNNALPKYISGAVKMLKQLDDVRQVQYLAAVSLKTGYSQEYLRRKLESPIGIEDSEDAAVSVTSPEITAKYFVAASLLTNQAFATLPSEKPYCETAFLSQLFDYIFECRRNGKAPQADMLYTVCPDASQEEYSRIIDVDFSETRRIKNRLYFEECKNTIINESLRHRRDELLKQLKSEPENADLLLQIADLNKRINS